MRLVALFIMGGGGVSSHCALLSIPPSIPLQGVYILTSEVSSLVCTLVVTLRKFISLLFSIYYFSNPFSVYHWIGTSLVFGGTIIFLDLINMIRNQLVGAVKDVKTATSTDNVADDAKYTEIKKKK